MTLGRSLHARNSPLKSPKLSNSSLRKKALIKKLLNKDLQFGNSSKANLKVIVRVRPENNREIESNSRCVIDLVDENVLVFDPVQDVENFFFHGQKQNKFRDINKKHHKDQKFIFERIYGPDSTNNEIFENTTMDIINTLLQGYNCSVFAYGATGSGKTYTMIGSEDNPGIIFLTVMELYRKIEELAETKQCEVGVSYLEIYNETVKDLLMPGKALNVHESEQVKVSGLSLHKPKDAADLLTILDQGNRNRSQHPTDANAESSRSHAVFQVFVKQQDKSGGMTSNLAIAKLSMIDLAGSERGAATGFKGVRFREGANINRSLLALGNCINALADGKRHIPYRDSKLTRLLKDSLGGNCRSVMIAAVSKSSLTFEDTFNTLRYANRAKTIKTTLKKNIMNVDQHVSQYVKIVEELQNEIISLKKKLAKYEEGGEGLENCQSVPQSKAPQEEVAVAKSEEEPLLLERLQELSNQLKSHQREMLQLEISERETEFDINIQQLKTIRMNVVLFASNKLTKGMQKSERLIENSTIHLERIQSKKEILKTNIEKVRCDIYTTYKNLKTFGPGGSTLRLDSEGIIKRNELEQTVRDYHQSNEYLKSVVTKLVSERHSSEKLVVLLLSTVKHFYLKLKVAENEETVSNKLLNEESMAMFNNVISMLDSTRIEWADLKNTDKSFSEQIIADLGTQKNPPINLTKLTELPIMQSMTISPLIGPMDKNYRRSIMKRTVQPLKKVVPVPVAQLLSPHTSVHQISPTQLNFHREDLSPSEPKVTESSQETALDLQNGPSSVASSCDAVSQETSPVSQVLPAPNEVMNSTFEVAISPEDILQRPTSTVSIQEETNLLNETITLDAANIDNACNSTFAVDNSTEIEPKVPTDQGVPFFQENNLNLLPNAMPPPKMAIGMKDSGKKLSFRSSKSSFAKLPSVQRSGSKTLNRSTSGPALVRSDSKKFIRPSSSFYPHGGSTSSLKKSSSFVKSDHNKENTLSSSRLSLGGRLYFPLSATKRTLTKKNSQRALNFFKTEEEPKSS